MTATTAAVRAAGADASVHQRKRPAPVEADARRPAPARRHVGAASVFERLDGASAPAADAPVLGRIGRRVIPVKAPAQQQPRRAVFERLV